MGCGTDYYGDAEAHACSESRGSAGLVQMREGPAPDGREGRPSNPGGQIGHNDLDRFTTDELVIISEDASAKAVAHYNRSTEIMTAAAQLPYEDKAGYAAEQARWQAEIAAGNEQYELVRAIAAEVHERTVCGA